MPEEIAIIALAALITGTIMIVTIVKSVLRYMSSKHQAAHPTSSLTSGELRSIIRDAVADATQPLADRIGDLEAQLNSQNRLASPPPDILEGVETYEPAPRVKTLGR